MLDHTLWILLDSVDDPDALCLFGEKNMDLNQLIKEQNVGGPRLILHHYHEAGVIHIRQHFYGEEVKTLGLDANALYLWSPKQ